MCTRDKKFTVRDIGDCLARGYDRTGFSEVDARGQRAWTVQLAKSSEQSVQIGTPAIALPPGRAGSTPGTAPGARTQ